MAARPRWAALTSSPSSYEVEARFTTLGAEEDAASWSLARSRLASINSFSTFSSSSFRFLSASPSSPRMLLRLDRVSEEEEEEEEDEDAPLSSPARTTTVTLLPALLTVAAPPRVNSFFVNNLWFLLEKKTTHLPVPTAEPALGATPCRLAARVALGLIAVFKAMFVISVIKP